MARFSSRSSPVSFRVQSWIVPWRSILSSSIWPGFAGLCWRPQSLVPSSWPRLRVQRLHLPPVVDRSDRGHSQHPGSLTPKDRLDLRRHPRWLEIRLDDPRHSAPNDHGDQLYVPCCACARAASRVCAERSQRRPNHVRADAFGYWLGVDPWSIPALLHTFVLPSPPPYSSGHVHFCCARSSFQLLHHTRLKPHHSSR